MINQLSAVILVGGKSSRMGENKAFLSFDGQTFLSKLSNELDGFAEILLSVNHPEPYTTEGLQVVEDIYPNCGPISGIHAALRACQSTHLLALSCDMPLFQRELAEYMGTFLDDTHDAFVLVTRDKRVHPLCAIYEKSAAPILETQIKQGNYRMMDALAQMKVRYIPLDHSVFPDDIVQNVNTPEDYTALIRQIHGSLIIAVCGAKNSGKTTLLTELIPRLKALGLRVAAIKHDGHDFAPDVPGTDSHRLQEAGADGVGIFSPHRYMLIKEQGGITPAYLASFFPDADLILLEGGKQSAYPKIEILRSEISTNPISDTNTLIALCSDLDIQIPGVPTLPLDDYAGLAQFIADFAKNSIIHR